jgi:serine protease AprX
MLTPLARAVALLTIVATLMISVTAAATSAPGGPSVRVSSAVLHDAANGRTSTFMVVLKATANLDAARALTDKVAKGRFVYRTLRDEASRTQAPIVNMLHRLGATYRSHWAVNALLVTGGRGVVEALAARDDIARIDPNPWIKSLLLPVGRATLSPNAPSTVEWNIAQIRAPQVWNHGDRGQGIVLGNIDTGQQWDHPALKPHYRGWNGSTVDHNYNWYDATDPTNRAPLDEYGHGTDTAGIMVGDDGGANRIGVAPRAKWMSCRSMDASGLGNPDTYITCIEFMIAPFDLDGNNPDPSKAPVAVSNSWYCSTSTEGCTQTTLLQPVQDLRAAGIVPVFAAGNEGSGCSTIGILGPPAQYDESFSVGATDSDKALASFSSRGPVTFMGTRIKPDISAPGVDVRSSYPGNAYATLSGTSFAAPHIAGVIALLYAAQPQLIGDVDATELKLENGAFHINSSACSSSGSYPNNLFGYGIVNAQAAVKP